MPAEHGHRGTRAIQRMVEYAPSTGGLALWVQHRDRSDDGPLVATDGATVFYRPAFEQLPLPEQTALVAHEVLHLALRHPQRLADLQQRLGDVDVALFTLCADAIVNSAIGHLSWLALPAGAVTLDRLLTVALGGDHPPETALLEWDVERLYRAIDDRRPDDGRGGGQSQRSASGGEGKQGSTGQAASSSAPQGRQTAARADGPRSLRVRGWANKTSPDLLPAAGGAGHDPEAQADETRTWSERLLRAHAGDGEFSMLRTLIADLPRTRTPWEQVLRTQLTRSLSQRLALSWSRPARSYIANQGRLGTHRLPFEPGTMPAKGAPRLVVVVDVSGSVDDDLMQRFAREIESITRRLEAGVTLVIGDQQVRGVERYEPGACRLADIAFHGGGGTDFTPLLEEADRHAPDITVVLTDLQGPARHRPRASVLWAVPEAHAAAVQPFGRKLVLA